MVHPGTEASADAVQGTAALHPAPRRAPWVAPSIRGGFNAHNTRLAFKRSNVDARAAGRRSQMSAAEELLWEACTRPPTASEWLALLRRSGERKRFGRWIGRDWRVYYRPRPFISPAGSPGFSGFCWRSLP